jgi:thioredoxin 1
MALSVNEQNFSVIVLNSSEPVLVNFWAPWCSLCRLIDPLLLQFQAEWKGQLKLVGINADENLKLATTYRLKSLPTLILFEQGCMIQRLEGFQGREILRRNLETMIFNNLLKSA